MDAELSTQTHSNGSANPISYSWPAEGIYRIPDWVYTSEEIFEKEVRDIFRGKTWNFVGLEAEIPEPGDFRRAAIATTSIIVVRGKEGEINVIENRCAHRGTEFCRVRRGKAKAAFICPYHQWQYDLKGNLVSIPFRRGVKGKGGMPTEFKFEDNGLRKLRVATKCGLIFASFSDDVEPLDSYLGPEVVSEIETMFKDRSVKILGALPRESA
jgi:phenylpropionate dioxygenase-like ring-hydroxylating dioxygenase large terminal subunit